jgi:autotransporter-associated beta strand protein
VVADTGSAVTLNIAPGKTLAWTGTESGVWNVRGASNWVDTVPPNGAELFYNADAVVFPDGAANPAVTIAGTPSPLAVQFSAASTNYTLTSSAGNQLSGAVGISKSGASTLTLAGPNLHDGPTAISGGTVTLAAATSLGSGAPGNGVSLSGGGRLNFTGAADLLATRDIAIGAGGASVTMTNAAAQTVSLPGNMSGAGDLTLGSGGAGAPTFVLGSPATAASGFSGNINVNSAGGGLTTVRLASSAAINGGTVALMKKLGGFSTQKPAPPGVMVLDQYAVTRHASSYEGGEKFYKAVFVWVVVVVWGAA